MPNVFSRWMLEQTSELVSPGLAAGLERIMAETPIPKPADHRGGRFTDMFELSLSLDEVSFIAAEVQAAVVTRAETSGTAGRGLGGFEEAWNEYLTCLSGDRT